MKKPSISALENWRDGMGRTEDELALAVLAEASNFLIHNKIIDDPGNLPEQFSVQIISCVKTYLGNKFISTRWSTIRKHREAQIADELGKIQSLLRSYSKEELYFYKRNAKLRGMPHVGIFSESIKASLEDARSYFYNMSKGKPGPRRSAALELSSDVAVAAFELAAGRPFKRNFQIQGKMNLRTADFVTIDCKFVEIVLKAIDPKITKSNVKTALLKLPPKKSGDA